MKKGKGCAPGGPKAGKRLLDREQQKRKALDVQPRRLRRPSGRG